MKITTSFMGQNCNLVHLFLVEFTYIFSFLEDNFSISLWVSVDSIVKSLMVE